MANNSLKAKGGILVDEYPLTYQCKVCENEIPIDNNYLTYGEAPGYLCNICKNFVAFVFEDELLQPETILDLGWNEGLDKRSMEIEDDLYIVKGSTKKDFLILNLLRIPALVQNDFHDSDEEQPYLLLFNHEKYLGFVDGNKLMVHLELGEAMSSSRYLLLALKEKNVMGVIF